MLRNKRGISNLIFLLKNFQNHFQILVMVNMILGKNSKIKMEMANGTQLKNMTILIVMASGLHLKILTILIVMASGIQLKSLPT